MSVLVDTNTRLVVQGITGSVGAFHTRQCIDYGTSVVAGVTPGKGGQLFDEKVPVFDTVWEARRETGCNASMVFVPAPAAADSILEAVDAGVELVVCITEGIPVMDMMRVKALMHGKPSRLIGPNCPGIITPGACKIGIMPGYIHKPGNVGVISRSGTRDHTNVTRLVNVAGHDPNLASTRCDNPWAIRPDESRFFATHERFDTHHVHDRYSFRNTNDELNTSIDSLEN